MKIKTINFKCGSCRVTFSRELEYGVQLVEDFATEISHCIVDPKEENAKHLGDDRKIACDCGNVDNISLVA